MLYRSFGETLCCLSLYLLCLLTASLLRYRLHRYVDPSDPICIRTLWRHSYRTSTIVAALAGLLLLLPSSPDWIPENWRGRGMFDPLPARHVLTPGMAEPVARETRKPEIAALATAITRGVNDGLPQRRRDIDWVPVDKWAIPGIPGYAYEYTCNDDGFELREPVEFDGESLACRCTRGPFKTGTGGLWNIKVRP